jgi:hypothetical protein
MGVGDIDEYKEEETTLIMIITTIMMITIMIIMILFLLPVLGINSMACTPLVCPVYFFTHFFGM